MKKRQREKIKKTDMPEFLFKEFTPGEDKIYEEAVNAYREAIAAGKPLRLAYESYAIADKELEAIIHADFLKIMIADLHFGKGQPLDQIAKTLTVSLELLLDTKKRMLQEAGVTAANEFGREYGSIIPGTND